MPKTDTQKQNHMQILKREDTVNIKSKRENTEKVQKYKPYWRSSTAEQKGKRKESVNHKIEQQK